MSQKAFKSEGEWGGLSIRPSKGGWLYSQWSRVQGSITGRVVLYPYSDKYPRGTDLSQPINEYGTTAAAAIVEQYHPIKVIRKGHTVQ